MDRAPYRVDTYCGCCHDTKTHYLRHIAGSDCYECATCAHLVFPSVKARAGHPACSPLSEHAQPQADDKERKALALDLMLRAINPTVRKNAEHFLSIVSDETPAIKK
jgi:hypothetical protein